MLLADGLARFIPPRGSDLVAETKFMKPDAEDIPVATFSEYFGRLTMLDPLTLFGDVSDEDAGVFRKDRAKALDEDLDIAMHSGRESASSALRPRGTIEPSSDGEEGESDDSDVCLSSLG